MIQYRTFRNPDPPLLMDVWNGSLTGRAVVQLRMAMLLEYFTFAKPYFDPAGLLVAEADGRVVGFAHGGFGPTADGSGLDPRLAVLCCLCVLPAYRRQRIGSELLRRWEAYARDRGAVELRAGPRAPANPFTFGVYGGSDSPGFLRSQPYARPFFEHHGYQAEGARLLYQRSLERTQVPSDARFLDHRQRYEIHALPYHAPTWWREAVLGPVEAFEFRLVDREGGPSPGRLVLWDMEPYSAQWQEHAVGVLDVEIAAEYRRKGLAKFLLSQTLRHLQEQFFNLVEAHAPEDDRATRGLLEGMGFTETDAGIVYRKQA